MSESFQFVGSLQTPLYFGWNSTRTGFNETVAMTTVGWTTHHAQAKMRFICQKSFDSKQTHFHASMIYLIVITIGICGALILIFLIAVFCYCINRKSADDVGEEKFTESTRNSWAFMTA
ncbi:uncharacterized protein LOC131942596 [Physella acuta]|uniref:uncharacterized protein LOC131942596 n=1 Tax=Physella acuta TaxID=109671 RepID=UPI0027DE13ED|nr:uncharacterized protein LOC131942596 [Physella acuta]